ncbi:MAG: response regulator transcription factor [Gaiellaceae bacterium]
MSENPRILLVEDNAIYREALELLLGLRPDVEIAGSVADAETALEFCADDCPDVVLLDYRLPGLDGVEATQILLERFSSLAVVCLTGLATERERQALIEAGAHACLTKDQELDEIVAAVHGAVESARER